MYRQRGVGALYQSQNPGSINKTRGSKAEDSMLHSYALMHCMTVLSFAVMILLMCIAICVC